MAGTAGRVLTGLGEGLASQAGPLLAPLVTALTTALDATDDLLTVPDGTSPVLAVPAVLDLDRTPYPEWLAQLAGVTVPVGMAREDVRTLVRTRGASRRGTPSAIVAAAASALTGTRRVELVERDGSPWRVTLTTYATQTPDPAALRAAVNVERPVGIVVRYVIQPGQDWGDVADQNLTFADLEAITVADLATAVPTTPERP